MNKDRDALLAQFAANRSICHERVRLDVVATLAEQAAQLRDEHFRAADLERVIHVRDGQTHNGLPTPTP